MKIIFFKIILHQIVEKNKGFVLQLVKRVLSILYYFPSFNLFIWKAIYRIKQSIMIIHSLTILEECHMTLYSSRLSSTRKSFFLRVIFTALQKLLFSLSNFIMDDAEQFLNSKEGLCGILQKARLHLIPLILSHLTIKFGLISLKTSKFPLAVLVCKVLIKLHHLHIITMIVIFF